ncbi:hypothetical protein ACLOAV_005895 [Pseudogymnoascus australis]
MKFSQSIIALAATGIVSGSPLAKRAGPTDADILQYALTLEHLEDNFYRQGLAKFTQAQFEAAGFDATFYANIQKVSSDETEHVNFLTSGLTDAGAKPVAACTYNFPLTDVKTFIATASVLEGVGVSAYLGAAADIMSKAYLTAAGSILTVEARHSSYIRAGLKQAPFAAPFDTPSPWMRCTPLPRASSPAVPSQTQSVVKAGSTIKLLTTGYTLKAAQGVTNIYAAFISVTGPTFVVATPVDGGFQVTVPKGFSGQSYAVLTSCNETVSDDTTAAGPAIIEIGN